MSGAEAIAAISLIDACIGITNTIIGIAHAVQSAQGLPPKLQNLFEKLPTIKELLVDAGESFAEGRVAADASKNAQPVLRQCQQALGDLEKIFGKACPKDEDNRSKRLWRGAKAIFLGRDSRLRELLVIVQDNLQLLEQKEIYIIGNRLDELRELTEGLEHDESGKYAHSGQGNITANEGGSPTNYVLAGSNNRQINNPARYYEGPSTHIHHTHLPSGAQTFQDKLRHSNTHISGGNKATRLWVISLCATELRPAPILSKNQTNHKKILAGLHYSTLTSRQDDIVAASDNTYGWIFQRDHQQPVDFRGWLETTCRKDLYWISGKAGSGKSTLMKFIASHPLVKDSLKIWACSDRLFIAQHYFWYAGSPIQNSEEGLLRSLLYQVCESDESIAEQLFPAIIYCGEMTTNICSLRSHVRQLSQIGQTASKKFCFFLDGLDEYRPDVEHTQLAKFALDLACLPNIKVVVSSRPWTAFEKTLTCQVKTGLCLHHFTKEDLRQLARCRLDSAASFLTKDQISDLAERVQESSQGVFLWAHLVTGSLQQRATVGNGFDELVECLNEYPSDLHDFLRDNIFKRIHSTFRRKETVKCLRLASMMHLEDYKLRTKYGGPATSWLNYWLVNQPNGYTDNIVNLLKQPMQCLTSLEMEHKRVDFSKTLEVSCRDLLHVFGDEVVFSHRSVFDFVVSEEMETELNKEVPAHFLDGNFFARIYVARCKMATSVSFSHTRANISVSRNNQANCLSAIASPIAQYADLHRTEHIDEFLKAAEEIFFQSGETICRSGCKHFSEIGDEQDQCLLFLLDYLCYRGITRYPERVAKRAVEQFGDKGEEEVASEKFTAICYQPSKDYVGGHWLRTNDFLPQMHRILSARHAEVRSRQRALVNQDDTETLARANFVEGQSPVGSLRNKTSQGDSRYPQKLTRPRIKPSAKQALPRRQSNDWSYPLDDEIELDYNFDDEGIFKWSDA